MCIHTYCALEISGTKHTIFTNYSPAPDRAWARTHQGLKIPPTTGYGLVTERAVNGGLLTKLDVPTCLLAGESGNGSFVVETYI